MGIAHEILVIKRNASCLGFVVPHCYSYALPPCPQCEEASPCFDGVTCSDYDDGFECASCPDGFIGDSVRGYDLQDARNKPQVSTQGYVLCLTSRLY